MHNPPKRRSPEPISKIYRSLILFSIAATFVLVTMGGIVRVTDSGLGCPDWPFCYGKIIPEFEYHIIIEYTHRMIASVVGMLVFSTTILTWWKLRYNRPLLLLLTTALVLVILAAWLGRKTVLSELEPNTVTFHLATAQGIFALLILAWVQTKTLVSNQIEKVSQKNKPFERFFFIGVVTVSIATFLVLLSGSYVVGKGAGSICPSWPLCDNNFFPVLSMGWIHMAHRFLAGVVGIITIWIAYLGWSKFKETPYVKTVSLTVISLVIIQFFIGAANPWSGFQSIFRALHLSLATALWGNLVLLTALSWKTTSPYLLSTSSPSWRVFRDYITLMKPRVISLLLVTALGGMFLASGDFPPLKLALLVLIGGTLASGGAQALNHYLEKDIDKLMSRTRNRPVASERVRPRSALLFGIILNIISFVILATWVNLLSAVLTLIATLFYVFIYTMWLKRSTSQNIVIGGAAGAIPPLVGWAAITGNIGLPAIYLFAIIFFWTPPHFWALALLIKNDYAKANVPMLPVVSGEKTTAWGIMLHLVILVALTILFFTIDTVGILYLFGAIILAIIFVSMALRLLLSGGTKGARSLYLYSLSYLFFLFILIMVDSVTHF